MAAQNALEQLVENMTLRQLADRTGRSVGDIVGWAMRSAKGTTTETTTSASAKKPGRKAKASAGSVDVRTPAGRKAYDQAVMQAVVEAKDPVSAPDVRAKAGGTPAQARAALDRLISGGKLGYKGRARGTRYFVR